MLNLETQLVTIRVLDSFEKAIRSVKSEPNGKTVYALLEALLDCQIYEGSFLKDQKKQFAMLLNTLKK